MRLINTTTYEIQEFYGDDIPSYAILSHTWDKVELTYQDLQHSGYDVHQGFDKVRGCCLKARTLKLEWAWIDTCCIDKTSSSELSEAINSMFRWYEVANVCLVYLSDLSYKWENDEGFVASRWFTRGWTLQELLAPKTLRFFDRGWRHIGTIDAHSPDSKLKNLVTKASGIHNLDNYMSASIACKMSWAAKRKTTRVEDQAYSLMGLFNVNMPLLYGEGSNAFYRLQLEILKESDDESIFAWSHPRTFRSGLLATSVESFAGSADVACCDYWRLPSLGIAGYNRPSYYMSNKGLCFTGTPLMLTSHAADRKLGGCVVVVVPLNCIRHADNLEPPICLYLQRPGGADHEWVRILAHQVLSLDYMQQRRVKNDVENRLQSFYIRRNSKFKAAIPAYHTIVFRDATINSKRFLLHHCRVLQDGEGGSISQSELLSAQRLFITIQPFVDFSDITLIFILTRDDTEFVHLVLRIADSIMPSLHIFGPYRGDPGQSRHEELLKQQTSSRKEWFQQGSRTVSVQSIWPEHHLKASVNMPLPKRSPPVDFQEWYVSCSLFRSGP
jgi:hypothetical protein